MHDSEKVISIMKAAYADLKQSIANNAGDAEKKQLADGLVNAVKDFDTKMKTVRQARRSLKPSQRLKLRHSGISAESTLQILMCRFDV